jgi:hypothetical protein
MPGSFLNCDPPLNSCADAGIAGTSSAASDAAVTIDRDFMPLLPFRAVRFGHGTNAAASEVLHAGLA